MLARSPGPLLPELALHEPGAGLPVSRWTLVAVFVFLAFLTALYGLFWRGGLASAPAGDPVGPANPTAGLASPPGGVERSTASSVPGLELTGTPMVDTQPATDTDLGTPNAGAPTLTQAPPGVTELSCGASPDWLAYTIRPNDTLFGLSLVLGVSVPELQLANCMGESTVLIAGQTFFVPFIPPIPATASLVPTKVEPSPPPETDTPPPATIVPTGTAVPTTPAPTSTAEPPTSSPTPLPPSPTVPITPSPAYLTPDPTALAVPGGPGQVS